MRLDPYDSRTALQRSADAMLAPFEVAGLLALLVARTFGRVAFDLWRHVAAAWRAAFGVFRRDTSRTCWARRAAWPKVVTWRDNRELVTEIRLWLTAAQDARAAGKYREARDCDVIASKLIDVWKADARRAQTDDLEGTEQ